MWLPGCAADAVLGDYTPSTCDFAEPPRNTSAVTLYLSTFWEDPKEKEALDRLLEHNPFGDYDKSTKQTRVAAQRQLSTAFVDDKLPDVFQANGGSDVLRWVGDGGEASSVCPLDRLSEANGWSNLYFAPSLAPVSCRGSLYALPVGIHKLNVLFYNRRLFDELNRQQADTSEPLPDPATLRSLAEWLDELERVQRLRAEPLAPSFVPLAIGGKRAWPLNVMAFENVLLSLDKDAYQTLWQGKLERGDARGEAELTAALKEMLRVLRRLVGFSKLSEEEDWQQAIQQVGRGEALFTVTGDWGWAQLEEAERADVVAVPFPGTASLFVYTPDSFAVPRESEQTGARARGFLQEVVARPEALLDFSEHKHSIPARNDFDPADLRTPELRKTYERFADCSGGSGDCELVLATSGLAPPPGFNGCFDDIEALISKAVTGSIPATFYENPRSCERTVWPPRNEEDAAARLVDELLEVARHQFVSECPR